MALKTDILIVGAGPTGLMLACQLIKHAVDFIIIDKSRGEFRSSGALVIHAASMEIFHHMGILQQVLTEAMPVNNISLEFNGNENIGITLNGIQGDELPNPPIILLEQSKLEDILRKYLIDKEIRVQTMNMTGFRYAGACIRADCMIDEQHRETILCRYLVGADGKDSQVRHLSGFRFQSRRDELPVFIMDFEGQSPVRHKEMYFSFGKQISFGAFPLGNNKYRLDGSIHGLLNETGKLGHELPVKMLQPAVTVEKIGWFSVFHGNYLLCDRFSADNVFLAGDAAHTHNPVGGQGMNSGFQDALNLSWKLAYVLKGLAGPSLLQTYTEERKPVVKRIMDVSSLIYRLITSDHITVTFIRTKVAPLLLKIMIWLLRFRYFRNYLFKGISQLWIRYRGRLISGNRKKGMLVPGTLFNFSKHGVENTDTSRYRLIVFSKLPGAQNYTELDSFPLEIREVAIPDNGKSVQAHTIRGNTCILIRPDNFIAMVSKEPAVKRIARYFKDLKNEENSYRT